MKQSAVRGAVAVLALGLSACAPQHATKASQINLVVDDAGHMAADADEQKVLDAVKMIQAGKIQLAVDGPLTEVIDKYEARYAGKPIKVFCAEGLADGLLYAALGQKIIADTGASVEVLGPAWAKAYWARGYAYNEMARYEDARRELDKALALSPSNSQYKNELAYVWQRKGDWEKSLALYKDAEDDAAISAVGGTAEVVLLQCTALRGQGYDLVELHRLDDAAAAYQACLKLQPGEPKSLGELGYIEGLRAKRQRTP